jgi:hypothetical protein
MDANEIKSYEKKQAIADTVAWMESVIEVHARAIKELNRYKERFVEATEGSDTFAKPVDHLSWFMNEIQNGQRNLRLDMAVTNAAKLARTADY